MSNVRRETMGYGDRRAPIGSEEWAKAWALDLYGAVAQLDTQPRLVDSFIAVGEKYEAWKLLKDSNGKTFRSFDDFCEAARPYGLATPAAKVKAAIAAVRGAKVVALVTVPPAKGGNQYTVDASGHDGRKQDMPEKTAGRLRAITRAPEQVRDLYTADLIGQKEAAKLGPKKPTPEQSALVTEVTNTIAAFVKERPKPKTEQEKRNLQQHVNHKVRTMLGEGVDDPVAKIVRLVEKLEPKDRNRLRDKLAQILGKADS